MDPVEIDPVKYGALWQKVQDYERRFEVVDKKLDKMEHQLDELLALANKCCLVRIYSLCCWHQWSSCNIAVARAVENPASKNIIQRVRKPQ